jgi:hypothetical protein
MTRIWKNWRGERSFAKVFEDIYPSAISICLTLVLVLIFRCERFAAARVLFLIGSVKLLPSALNISAIAVGFLATSLSLLVSLSGTKVVKDLKESGHYERLISFFMKAIYSSSVWAFVSGWMTTIDLNKPDHWRAVLFWLWCFLTSCSVLSYARATDILKQVLMVEARRSSRPDASEIWAPPA